MAMRLGAPAVERELELLYRRHRHEIYRAVLRDVRDPEMALNQATVTMLFCIAFGLFYVRAVARNREK